MIKVVAKNIIFLFCFNFICAGNNNFGPSGSEEYDIKITSKRVKRRTLKKIRTAQNAQAQQCYYPQECLLFSVMMMVPLLGMLYVGTQDSETVYLKDCNICPDGNILRDIRLEYIRHNYPELDGNTHVNYTGKCEGYTMHGESECSNSICNLNSNFLRKHRIRYNFDTPDPDHVRLVRVPKHFNLKIDCNSEKYLEKKNNRWGKR